MGRWLIISLLLGLPMMLAGEGRAMDAPPPPPLQYSADCSHPVYATDHLVCADPALRALDAGLRDLLRGRTVMLSSPYIETDADWFKRRGLCAFQAEHEACARGAYAERIALLRAVAAPPPAGLEPARCPGTDVSQLGSFGDALLLYDRESRPLVVAFGAEVHRPWTAFASISHKGGRLSLRLVDGRTIRCEVRPRRP